MNDADFQAGDRVLVSRDGSEPINGRIDARVTEGHHGFEDGYEWEVVVDPRQGGFPTMHLYKTSELAHEGKN